MQFTSLDRIGPAACRRLGMAAPLIVAVAMCAFGTVEARAQISWPWSGWSTAGPEVGTPEWWEQHRNTDAVFEIGKGYRVPGVEGYFDQNGRRIGQAASQAVAQPEIAPQTPHPDELVDDEIGILPGLDPRITYGRVINAVGLGPNDEAARREFAEGEQLFQQADYGAAAKRYQAAAERAISMRLKEDALFMTAESHYFNDRYIDARDAYNVLADKYPSTRYLDKLVERQWKIAQYWEEYETHTPDWAATPNGWDKTRPWFDTIGHAIRTYDNIRMNDPTGPRADDAIMATAGIYFNRNRFDDADYHYTLLRREYPRSDFQFEAHLLGLQSKLRKYQGADYDGTPLEEAEKLVVQLRRNFTGQLSAEERERLKVVSAQLNQELAMRDMRMAQYYDGTKHYAAARGYYADVVRNYPDSELATQARERLAQISNEPDAPPKRLAWFVDRFPQGALKRSVASVPELKNGTLLARPPDSPGTATR